MKIYGPYTRKDGRKHICIVHPNGKRETISYPKWLLEQKLGRKLLPNETCDHIDDDFRNDDFRNDDFRNDDFRNDDFRNDDPNNLQVLTRVDNALKGTRFMEPEFHNFICPECGHSASKRMNQVKANLKKGKQGPFCSRACAGKFNSRKG